MRMDQRTKDNKQIQYVTHCNVPLLSEISLWAISQKKKQKVWLYCFDFKKKKCCIRHRIDYSKAIQIYCSDVKEKFLLRHRIRNKCSWSILIAAVGRVKRGNCLSTSQSQGSALFLGFTIHSHFPMDFLLKDCNTDITIGLYHWSSVYRWLKTATDPGIKILGLI